MADASATDRSTLFQPIAGRRSFEEVAAQIRRQIADGNLREGDRLPPERDLAAALGVSRNTVREALRALEHAGLLNQRPGVNGGAYVASNGAQVIKTALTDLVSLGTTKASDLIEARLVIGREVVRLACERADEDDLQALRDNYEKSLAETAAGNLTLRVRHSLDFHRLLATASKNPVLILLTNVLADITMEFVRAIGVMPNEYVLKSRARMIEYLTARDTEAAVREIDDYLRTTLRVYLNRAD